MWRLWIYGLLVAGCVEPAGYIEEDGAVGSGAESDTEDQGCFYDCLEPWMCERVGDETAGVCDNEGEVCCAVAPLDTDADADGDTDADGDGDTDADGDADADADGDVDADADADTDNNCDGFCVPWMVCEDGGEIIDGDCGPGTCCWFPDDEWMTEEKKNCYPRNFILDTSILDPSGVLILPTMPDEYNCIAGNLEIKGMIGNVDLLKNIRFVEGFVSVSFVKDPRGLQNIRSIGRSLYVSHVSGDMGWASFLSFIGEGLSLYNTDLETLNGLEKIEALNGSLNIHDNPVLANLSGIGNIKTIDGNVFFDNNEKIDICDLCAFLNQLTVEPANVNLGDSTTEAIEFCNECNE